MRITQQPQHHVFNSFGLFNDEKLLHDWRKSQGLCGCRGKHFTTLTNSRLLSRYEECAACNACCEPAHDDSSIFLYDIAQLLETTQARGIFEVLLTKCVPCCCRGTKHLEIRGAFNSQIVYLSKDDVAVAKPAIAEAIARQNQFFINIKLFTTFEHLEKNIYIHPLFSLIIINIILIFLDHIILSLL